MNALDLAFRKASPRLTPRPVPLVSTLISLAVGLAWLGLFAAAFIGQGVFAWSIGIAYVGYDTLLLLFVAFQTLPLWRAAVPAPLASPRRPRIGVIVAAHNEAPVLAATLDALLGQDDVPDQIWLADDGSNDASAQVMRARYGLDAPGLDLASAPSPLAPALRWLRLAHRGKARALNAALAFVETDVVLTVDADTILQPDAIGAMRRAFASDPALVVGGGVLAPRCAPTPMGRVLETFQTYEYVRNFLAREAWSRQNALLLISGAFAAFRRDALVEVGGFDADCLVEDYELIHRLHRHAIERGLNWRVRILSGAVASTDAPASINAFLRQRRRWFAGFLQTQYWNRDMTGSRKFGALGLAMMPVKALDTLQPIYGLTAFALLVGFLFEGRFGALLPASGVMLAKIVFDLVYVVGAVALYRRWTSGKVKVSMAMALICAVVEPFSFQLLRHLGAARGWVAILTGGLAWGGLSRPSVAAPTSGA